MARTDDPFDVNDGPVGWVCPRCRHVWAPMEPECVRCAVRLDPPPAASPPVATEDVLASLPPGPLIRLPPHMDSPGFAWHAKIGGQWRELFRGLQARRLSVSHDEALSAVADIEFRLAPQEDGQADG